MDNAEKNRYIVEEVLGECWHEWEALYEEGTNYIGCKCGEVYTDLNENPNFSRRASHQLLQIVERVGYGRD